MPTSSKKKPAGKSNKPSAKAKKPAARRSSQIASLEAIAKLIVLEAKRIGASDCEVLIRTGQSVDTSVRLGVVEQLEGAQSRRISFAAYDGHKSAVTSSSDFRRPALRKLVKDTIDLARASEEDPWSGPPDKKHLAKEVPDLDLYDPAIPAIPVERKIQLALDTEAIALAQDPRLTNSNGATFSDGGGITVFANSRGFIGGYEANYCSLGVSVVASEEGQMQTNGWYSTSRTFSGMESPEYVGKKAAERALRQLGATKVKSQVVPVVYDPYMAARLISMLVSAASGRAIDRKSTFLVGKLGETVASKLVTIIDDPLMPGRLGSRPFDGEGLALKRRIIVDEGKLVTYLVDAYAGRKLGCEPNSGSTGNLYLEAGNKSADQIIASVENGLYLTNVSGMGFNGVTGDYSLGASGQWIEDGQLSFPVSGITIASNLLDMFAGVIAVGNDLEFRSSTCSPTILIEKMTVAGE